jgi:HNH endonuclease
MSLSNLQNGGRVWVEYLNNQNPPSKGFRKYEMLRGLIVQGKERKQHKHELMKKANADDCVVHFEQSSGDKFIVGVSIVQGRLEPVNVNGEDYYQIPLHEFEQTKLVPLKNFIERNEDKLRREIEETAPKHFPFQSRKGKLVLAQNYFTEASPKLVRMMVEELGGVPTPPLADGTDESRPARRERSIEVYDRDRLLVRELRRLYKGRCQLCGSAPFEGVLGDDLLEGHHIVWLSRGGSDTQANLMVLCPNHHAAIHSENPNFSWAKLEFKFGSKVVPVRLNLHLSAL